MNKIMDEIWAEVMSGKTSPEANDGKDGANTAIPSFVSDYSEEGKQKDIKEGNLAFEQMQKHTGVIAPEEVEKIEAPKTYNEIYEETSKDVLASDLARKGVSVFNFDKMMKESAKSFNMGNWQKTKRIADAKASDNVSADDVDTTIKDIFAQSNKNDLVDVEDVLSSLRYKDAEGNTYYGFKGKRLYGDDLARDIVGSYVDERNHWINMGDSAYREQWSQSKYGIPYEEFVKGRVAYLEEQFKPVIEAAEAYYEEQEKVNPQISFEGEPIIDNIGLELGKLRSATNAFRDNTFWRGVGAGSVEAIRTATFDFGGVLVSAEQKDALNKYLEGKELNAKERLLVEMAKYNQTLGEEKSKYRKGFDAADVGEGLIGSIGFMAPLGVQSAIGIGKSIGKSLAEQSVKQAFNRSIKEGVKLGLTKTGAWMANTSARTALSTMPYQDYAQRRLSHFQFTDNGLMKEEVNPFADMYRAYASTFAEIAAEDFGGLLDDGMKAFGVKMADAKFFNKLSGSKFADRLKDFTPAQAVIGGLKGMKLNSMVGEVAEEYVTAAIQPLVTGEFFSTINEDGLMPAFNKHYADALTSEFALNTFAVCGALSAGGTLAKGVSGAMTAVEITNLRKDTKALLEGISDESLRNTLYTAINSNEADRFAPLAQMKWNSISAEDASAALKVIFNDAKTHAMRGEAMETERLKVFSPYLLGAINKSYRGVDVANPTPTTEVVDAYALDEAGNEVPIGNVIYGDMDNPNAIVQVVDANGMVRNVPVAGTKFVRTSLSDYISEMYAMMFSTSISKERLNELIENVRGITKMDKEAYDKVLEENGFSVYRKGENVVLADGRFGTVRGGADSGSYIVDVADANGNETTELVGFESILHPTDLSMAEAQAEAQAEGSMDAPIVLPTTKDGRVSLDGINDGKVLARVLPSQMGGKQKAIEAIDAEIQRLETEQGKPTKQTGLDAMAEANERAESTSSRIKVLQDARKALAEESAQPTRKLQEAQAENIIRAMQESAEVAREMELTSENWRAEFGEDGVVKTPIGEVKMGDNQYVKLLERKREGYFGMIKPTLTNPDIVLEEYDPAPNAERDSKYLFVKTFVKNDGTRYVHFESVTVKKGSKEVSISSHEITPEGLQKKMHNDNVVHLKDLFLDSGVRLTEPSPSKGPDLVPTPNSSESEDTTTNPKNQIFEGENSDASAIFTEEQRRERQAEMDAMSTFDFSRDYRRRNLNTEVSRNTLHKFIDNINEELKQVTDEAERKVLEHRKAQYEQTLKDMGAKKTIGEDAEFKALVEKASEALGLPIIVTDEPFANSRQNGIHREGKDGNAIYINSRSTQTEQSVGILAHEIVHEFKKFLKPEEWAKFEDVIMTARFGKDWSNSEAYKKEIESIQDVERRSGHAQGVGDEKAREEAVAYAIQDYIFNGADGVRAFEAIVNQDLNWRDKLMEALRKVVDKLRSLFGNLDAEQNKAVQEAIAEFENVFKRYADAEKINKVGETEKKAIAEANATDEVSHSLALADVLEAKSEAYHQKNATNVSAKTLVQANSDIQAMAEIMRPYLDQEMYGAPVLPKEVYGKGLSTIFKNQSYGASMENTTICLRTLAYIEFVDDVKEKLGRPLTTEESFLASQMLYDIATDPQCLYCYVSLDRKAYDESFLSYLKQRDDVLKMYDAIEGRKTKNAIEEVYQTFLGGRKDTPQMKARFNMWIDAHKKGLPMITAAELRNTKSIEDAEQNSDANLVKQIKDAKKYAQSASWAKKIEDYRAYTGELLKISENMYQRLNNAYGLRFYSFSEYTPAFIVENMQMMRDAALKGLRGLAYTKEIEFAKIFAPTNANINISIFGRRDADGNMVADTRQGADWVEAQALREQYPNVGLVFVATNDADVEWALAQDFIDVVIPFHIVRTGSNIADFYEWTNYKDMQEDKGGKSILPNEHNNDKETFLRLAEERGLTPRFSKWVDNPNYMKLVNETRRASKDTPFLQPIFNLEEAKASFKAFVDKGGYFGGWYNVDEQGYQDGVEQVYQDIVAGKTAKDVDYGRQDIPADDLNTKRKVRQHNNVVLRSSNSLPKRPNTQEVVSEADVVEESFSISRDKAEFDVVRDFAVENKGVVMPNLAEQSVPIVKYGDSEKQVPTELKGRDLERWAKKNIIDKDSYVVDSNGVRHDCAITATAIEKYLSSKAIDKSVSRDLHLKVLPLLSRVLANSVEVEVHPDYNKVDEVRKPENGYNAETLMHRFYGAVEVDGEVYRAKSTIKEYRDKNTQLKPYTYEVTNIELLTDSAEDAETTHIRPVSEDNNSISATKLLQNVEKSYDLGKKVLEESVDESFSISRNNEATIDKWLGKREDFTDEVKSAFKEFIADFKPATQLATTKWFANGVIRIPEDMPKVEQAMEIAQRKKVDALQYNSPMEIIDQLGEQYKPKEKLINPDDVPTLTNKVQVPNTDITIYDVDDSDKSRKAFRELMNSHLGKESSPWCLLQADSNGVLTEESARYWKHYNRYPKRAAFNNGKLVAFFASDDKPTWWDREDSPSMHIGVIGKIEGDALRRSATTLYSEENGEKVGYKNIHKGNKHNGVYESWYDLEHIHRKGYFVNGRREGVFESWHRNGTKQSETDFKDNLKATYHNQWDESGNLEQIERFDLSGHKGFRYNFIRGREDKSTANFWNMSDLEYVNIRWGRSERCSLLEIQKGDVKEWFNFGETGAVKTYSERKGRVEKIYTWLPASVEAQVDLNMFGISKYFKGNEQIVRFEDDSSFMQYPQGDVMKHSFKNVAIQGRIYRVEIDSWNDGKSKNVTIYETPKNEETGRWQNTILAVSEDAGGWSDLSTKMRASLINDIKSEIDKRYDAISKADEYIAEDMEKQRVRMERLGEKFDGSNVPVFENVEDGMEFLHSSVSNMAFSTKDSFSLDRSQSVEEIAEPRTEQESFSILREEDTDTIFATAKEEFASTNDWLKTGWLMPDGTQLDFAEGGDYRGTDHRAIGAAYKGVAEHQWQYLQDFESRGGIRIHMNRDGKYGTIEMTIKPTAEQKKRLRSFIGAVGGNVDVDFMDENYNTAHSASYEGVSPARVLSGITNFYDEGIKPKGNVSYSLERTNEQFNSKLSALTEENSRSIVLNLGMPSAILISCGVDNKPIRLYGAKLLAKAKKHNYDINDLRDLPLYIAAPIAVFKGVYEGSFAILTEVKIGERNVLAALTVGKGGHDVEFNIVTSVYDKRQDSLVRWINNGRLLYADKEKALNYFSVSAPIAEAQNNQELISATKIILDFENPKLLEEKVLDYPSTSAPIADTLDNQELNSVDKDTTINPKNQILEQDSYSVNRDTTTVATPELEAEANPSADVTKSLIDAIRKEIEAKIDLIVTKKDITFEEIEKLLLDEDEETKEIRELTNVLNRTKATDEERKLATETLQSKYGLSVTEAKRKLREIGRTMSAIQQSTKGRYKRIIKSILSTLKTSPNNGIVDQDIAIWMRRSMTKVFLDIAEANLKASQKDSKTILTKKYEGKNKKGEKEGKGVGYVASRIIEDVQSFVKQFYQRKTKDGEVVVNLDDPTLLWGGIGQPNINTEIETLANEVEGRLLKLEEAINAGASQKELDEKKMTIQIAVGKKTLLETFRTMISIATDIAETEKNIKEVREELTKLQAKEWRDVYNAKLLVEQSYSGRGDAADILSKLRKLGYADAIEAQKAIEQYEDKIEALKGEIYGYQRQLASEKMALLDAMKAFNTAMYGVEKEGRIALKAEKAQRKEDMTNWRVGILRSVRSPLFANIVDYNERDKKIENANGYKYTRTDNFLLRNRGDGFLTELVDTMEYVARKADVMSIPNAWLPYGFYYQMILHPEYGLMARADWRYHTERAIRALLDLMVKKFTGYDSVDKLSNILNKELGITYNVAETDQDGNVKPSADMSAHSFTVDEALYIRAAIKQDGIIGGYLTAGLTTDQINNIVAEVERRYPRLCALADWIQGVDGIYERLYTMNNEVYRKKNGRDLDHTENYEPVVRKQGTVPTETNLGETMSASRMANGIGSNKKRVRNNIAMDLNARFFDVLDGHISDVIQWVAYADLFDKMNNLLGSPLFRKMMQVQGLSKTNLENCFLRATGERLGNSESGRGAKIINTVVRNVVAANVVGNLNTALKQFAGTTAALSTNISPEIYYHFVKNFPLITNITTAIEKGWRAAKGDDIHKEMDVVRSNYTWALKNIPTFAERVDSGNMGMEIFQRDGLESWRKVSDWLKKYGMAANKFMDTIVSASVAKTIYEMEYKKLRRRGLTHDKAHDDARFMAAVLINQTQQSDQGAFLSEMQSDRKGVAGTLAYTVLTAYNNNQLAMDRNARAALINMISLTSDGGTTQRVAMLAEEYENRGLDSKAARRWAKWDLTAGLLTQAKIYLHNTTINPILWNALPNAIVALTGLVASSVEGGGDDDEAVDMIMQKQLKEFAEKVLERGWVYLLPTSNIVGVKDFADAYFTRGKDIRAMDLFGGKSSIVLQPLARFIDTVRKYNETKGNSDIDSRITGFGLALAIIDTATRYGLGVSTKTMVRMCEGMYDALTKHEVEDFMNATTQSGVFTKLYASSPRKGETMEQYIERVAGVYKIVDGYSKAIDMDSFRKQYVDRMDEIMLYNTDIDYDKFKEDMKEVKKMLTNIPVDKNGEPKEDMVAPSAEEAWRGYRLRIQNSYLNEYKKDLKDNQNWDEEGAEKRKMYYRRLNEAMQEFIDLYNADSSKVDELALDMTLNHYIYIGKREGNSNREINQYIREEKRYWDIDKKEFIDNYNKQWNNNKE